MLRMAVVKPEFRNFLVLLGLVALMLVPVLLSELLYSTLN